MLYLSGLYWYTLQSGQDALDSSDGKQVKHGIRGPTNVALAPFPPPFLSGTSIGTFFKNAKKVFFCYVVWSSLSSPKAIGLLNYLLIYLNVNIEKCIENLNPDILFLKQGLICLDKLFMN